MASKVAPDLTDSAQQSYSESGDYSLQDSFECTIAPQKQQNLRKHALYHSKYRLFPNQVQKSQVQDGVTRTGLFFNSETLPPWMCLPQGKFRNRWDLFIIFLVIYNVIVIPLDLAFATTESYPTEIIYLDTFIDCFFAADIILNFRTALVTYDGILITDTKVIATSYLRKWFFIDLIATVPFDLLLVAVDNLQLLAIMKTPRLFRIGRILRYLENSQYANFMRIFRLFVLFFLLVHWVGCIWILIKDWPPGWEDLDLESQYVRGIYESAQMLVGDNVEPQNYSERTFVMIVMFMAACVNASIFGNMAVLIQNLDRQGRKHTEKMDLINEHMWYSKVPPTLAQDIQNYYDLLWIRQRELFYSKDPFVDLSMGLKKALKLEQYQDLALKTDFLQTASPGFLEELLIELKPQMAMPMFMLTDEGNTGNDMFLVSKGKLKVYVNGNWVGRIEEGEYFGEIAMLLKCGRRSATVITHEYCDLFIIKRNSFENLMFDYPKDVQEILRAAKKKFARTETMLDVDTLDRMSIQDTRDANIWRTTKPSKIDTIRPMNKAYRQNFKHSSLVSGGRHPLHNLIRDYEERRKSMLEDPVSKPV